MQLTKCSAAPFQIPSKACSLHFCHWRAYFFMCRNDSGVLADTLRELAAFCLSIGLATDVAPGFQQKSRGFFVCSSQPTPLPLTFSHSDQDGVKPVYGSCCGKVGQFLHPHKGLCCHESGTGPAAEARGCRQRMGRRAQPAAVPASSTR